MTILLSVSEQSFYDDAIPYPSFPEDVIEVSGELHMELLDAMNKEGRKVYLKNGAPVLSDPLPDAWHEWDATKNEWTISKDGQKAKDLAETAALAQDKDKRIQAANDHINNKQWPSKLSLGRLSGEERTQFNSWLDYLDALEAVDISTTLDINWPTPPAK